MLFGGPQPLDRAAKNGLCGPYLAVALALGPCWAVVVTGAAAQPPSPDAISPVPPFAGAPQVDQEPAPSTPAPSTPAPVAAPEARVPVADPTKQSDGTSDVVDGDPPPLNPASPQPSETATAVPESTPADVDLELAGSSVPDKLVYRLERVDVRGNRTRPSVILDFLPLLAGSTFDPNDPRLTQARLRLMGTGWFDQVTLALERGAERGAVILVVEVVERNTLLIDRIVAGLSRVVDHSGARRDPVRPYAGLGLRETNLLGLGIGISGAVVASVAPETGQVLQYGLDVRYADGTFAGSDYDLSARLFHNHAREFFGRKPASVSVATCPVGQLGEEDPPCDPDEGKRAVVIYDRTGVGLGSGNDIDDYLHYTFGWLGERVGVNSIPLLASTQRGRSADNREAIDFRIDDDASVVSSVELGLFFDTRDHPATPSSGDYLALRSRIGAGMFGSDYDFARLEVEYRHHLALPWHHQLQLGLFAGSVFGRAPFFYHFYAADLSALLPPRQLELNLDHRRTHNLLGTSILEMAKEELAARLDAEYLLPLLRGGSTVRRLDAYFGMGVFLLARRDDLRVAIPGYDGLSRIPVDLTFDVGVVADTDFGLFKVGFSSLIGFLPDLGQESP